MSFTKFYKKYIEPFIALGILIMLIILVFSLVKEHQLKEEISQNCGWEGEDYSCYCKKSDVIEIQKMINGNLDIPNITFVES